MQEVKAGLFKMLTAKNPECSRCCRFVGTQFESGQDYGEHGNAYIPTGMGSGECALPRIWWFESSCKHRGARYGEHGMGSTEMSIFLSWSKGSDIVLD